MSWFVRGNSAVTGRHDPNMTYVSELCVWFLLNIHQRNCRHDSSIELTMKTDSLVKFPCWYPDDTNKNTKFLPTAQNRPSVFVFFCVWSNSGWGGGVGLLKSLVFVHHDLRSDRLCTSLHTLHLTLDASSVPSLHIRHGTLDTSSLLRWRTLHLTLDASSVLRCTYVRVRWIRLLYFFAHTSCYVGHVFSTSLHILHVTLDTSSQEWNCLQHHCPNGEQVGMQEKEVLALWRNTNMMIVNM